MASTLSENERQLKVISDKSSIESGISSKVTNNSTEGASPKSLNSDVITDDEEETYNEPIDDSADDPDWVLDEEIGSADIYDGSNSKKSSKRCVPATTRKSKSTIAYTVKDIDDSDDESIVFNPSKIKSKKSIKKKKPSVGQKQNVATYDLRDLKCMPSELKKVTDWLLPEGYGKKKSCEAYRDQIMAELLKLSKDDPETASGLVVELMNRPEKFWAKRGVMAGGNRWNYDLEEVGLICVDILPHLISNKHLLMETVLKVGKIASTWRHKQGVAPDKLKSAPRKMIPKTMTKCAQILLSEGELEGFLELFEDFRRDLKNVNGEKTLILYRFVANMLEKKIDSSDSISLGGTSLGTSFTGKSLGPQVDTIIAEMKSAFKDKRDIDWLMPLFTWYVMEEKSADDIKDLLTENRDENVDHLPAHLHLLDFLFQEYLDETDILLEELKIFSERFYWEPYILTYCKLLLKNEENDDLNDSFDSNDESNANVTRLKIENCRLVYECTLKFLDYEMNRDNRECWELLTESLRVLVRDHKERAYIQETFGDRGGWWMKLNFHNLDKCDPWVLLRKGIFLTIVYGKDSEHYVSIYNAMERMKTGPAISIVEGLMKELRMVADTSESINLETFKKDISEEDKLRNNLWLKNEWKKIRNIRDFAKEKRRKTPGRRPKPVDGDLIND